MRYCTDLATKTRTQIICLPAQEEDILMMHNVGYEESLEKVYQYLNTGTARADTAEKKALHQDEGQEFPTIRWRDVP